VCPGLKFRELKRYPSEFDNGGIPIEVEKSLTSNNLVRSD